MNTPNHPLTVKWLLFSFKGRIGRKSFLLAALLLLLIQLAIFAYIAGFATETTSGATSINSDSPLLMMVLFMLPITWLASAWCLLALAVKRLHDIGLPVALGLLLIIPGIAGLAWIVLAFLPSKQETNEHGPVPFPKN